MLTVGDRRQSTLKEVLNFIFRKMQTTTTISLEKFHGKKFHTWKLKLQLAVMDKTFRK
jgi:hypothetical protein